jgi:5'-nucleotidase
MPKVVRWLAGVVLTSVMGLGGLCAALGAASADTKATPIPVTFIHTNDLHSHFRPERTPLGLGGIARLKTAIDRIRASNANSLVLDGGDWSEGNAYYMLGTGRETLKTMDMLGYDVAVVGNHDWLNGPDRLLDAYESAHTRMSLVAANVDLKDYSQADRFKRLIPPYVIREVAGARIAFIGVLTYEKIYDKYMKPVGIQEPFIPVAKLANALKKQVDAVVAISHNSIMSNKALLQTARDVDLVIGAHDHVKLTDPVTVNRPGGTTAWIVETGCWGRYLGRVDLTIEPRGSRYSGSAPKVNLLRYGLTQMDASIPEDLGVLTRVTTLETELEALYREPIFHDHVADVEEDLTRDGSEPLMGDLAVDSYREATQAEVAFDEIQFIYGEIHPGAIRTVDVLNAAPAIYNPETGKSWTVQTVPLQGRAIENLLKLFYSSKTAANALGIATSGIQMIYTPITDEGLHLPGGVTLPLPTHLTTPGWRQADSGAIIKDLKIGGRPFDPNRKYLAAIGGGILEAFRFLDSTGIQIIPLGDLRDSGREGWRIMKDYLAKHSPVSQGVVEQGNRARSLAPDLTVAASDVRSRVKGLNASGELEVHVDVTVRNFGATTAPAGAVLELASAAEGLNTAVRPTLLPVGGNQVLPALKPGDKITVSFDVSLKGGERGLYRLDALLGANDSEVVHSNDHATVWLSSGT